MDAQVISILRRIRLMSAGIPKPYSSYYGPYMTAVQLSSSPQLQAAA